MADSSKLSVLVCSTAVGFWIVLKLVTKQNVSFALVPLHKRQEFVKETEKLLTLDQNEFATNVGYSTDFDTKTLSQSNDSLPYHLIAIRQIGNATLFGLKLFSPKSDVVGHISIKKSASELSFGALAQALDSGCTAEEVKNKFLTANKVGDLDRETMEQLIDRMVEIREQSGSKTKKLSDLKVDCTELKGILDADAKIMLALHESSCVTLGGLVVHPSLRRKGLGKALAYGGIIAANKLEQQTVNFLCTPKLDGFYAKLHAFRDSDRVYESQNVMRLDATKRIKEMALSQLRKMNIDIGLVG